MDTLEAYATLAENLVLVRELILGQGEEKEEVDLWTIKGVTKELQAVRVEREAVRVDGGDYSRFQATEWYARGLGLVRSESGFSGVEIRVNLVGVEDPADGQ